MQKGINLVASNVGVATGGMAMVPASGFPAPAMNAGSSVAMFRFRWALASRWIPLPPGGTRPGTTGGVMAPVPGRVYTRSVDGLGVIALIVGLAVALSPPVRAGDRDTTTAVWAWVLVAVASVLILAAALAPPTPR
jgi:hypothetical protein